MTKVYTRFPNLTVVTPVSDDLDLDEPAVREMILKEAITGLLSQAKSLEVHDGKIYTPQFSEPLGIIQKKKLVGKDGTELMFDF